MATDFDGTLAPIVAEPDAARPLPGVVDVLERLVARVLRVAVISGRSTAALRRLLPVEGLLLLGDYGQTEPPAGGRLAQFNAQAAGLVAEFPGVRLEEKPASTSVHYRSRPDAGPALLAAARRLAAPYGLDVRAGRLVIEVLPGGWDKARALRRLVDELDPRAVAYAGDDHGDRGCFEYLATLAIPHLAVGVASPETPPEVFEACDLVVDGPKANLALLSRLAEATASARP